MQTDGGKRGSEIVAASVVIGPFTVQGGRIVYEPWYAESTLLPGSVSVFESEAIAVERGAQWVGAAVRDLTEAVGKKEASEGRGRIAKFTKG